MKIDFRIDWGYQMLYSRRHYHPFYHWDGHLECSDFSEMKLSMREYPPAWWGPCHSAVETPMDETQWKSTTRRKIAGIRVKAECAENAKFKLVTLSGTFEFSAADIIEKGHFSFPVGPKYAFCAVTVCRTGYLWFRPAPREEQKVFEAGDLALPQTNSHRMELAVLKPCKNFDMPLSMALPDAHNALCECLCHIQAMILKAELPDGENHAKAEIPMELLVNGKTVSSFTHYFRSHDGTVQMLEGVWARFPMDADIEKISLKNSNPDYPLYISRVSFESKVTKHLQMTLPPWALAGETLVGKIFALHNETVKIQTPDAVMKMDLSPGWNEFEFRLTEAGRNVKLSASAGKLEEEAFIKTVYALKDETPELMVGYDMTVVPHDKNGFMDWLLDYTSRTRLGNTVVFRNFRNAPSEDDFKRWGEFCRKHRIYAQSVNFHQNDTFPRAAGEYLHNAGRHEYPGVVYAKDPEKDSESADMKDAYERYIAFLKDDVDKVKAIGLRPAYGDASGGHRHCYLAGASFIRTETMVPHTQHICSLARPAAEALGKGDWGVHIAIQHAVQLYHEEHHLGQYFLSLYQPWMMGASMIYEEDSLFLLFKEERQCWDDALTKGKRDMTREFFRFVKTHPRKASPVRNIAFLEGRYAAPFNGFICGTEQDPHYSVWGKFGNNSPEWGHGQAEKCRHLLDVLMPGASVQPMRQRFEKRRFFFSGTPYGDFDQVPIEASDEYFKQYKLLLNFGWNTMIAGDYEKLKNFVHSGGTLFTGIPQFSTHVRRDFLKDMKELSLWNNGDLSEFCGVKILGRGNPFNGFWNAAGKEKFVTPELSRIPNDSPDEDGPCALADIEFSGAETVAWDADSGAPLIVRNKFGKGQVYLICAWAYPGHETLSELVSSWTVMLAEQHRGDSYVDDPSGEVFWNFREESPGVSKVMLLNTDWSSPGNEKTVTIHAGERKLICKVIERQPKIITVLPSAFIEAPAEIHLEILSGKGNQIKVRAHGAENAYILIHKEDKIEKIPVDFNEKPFSDLKQRY
ncbi:MAG: hypothetical protein A2017_14700 [Lentisphaerae bacterium GWF2_44_16]|nr:MAG: hypothetical protein A2017_14700 [Lentisphaerae bacterium GWF2_44_16]